MPKSPLVFNSGARRSPFADQPGTRQGVAQFPFRDIRLASQDTSMPPADLFVDGSGTPGGSPYRTHRSRPLSVVRRHLHPTRAATMSRIRLAGAEDLAASSTGPPTDTTGAGSTISDHFGRHPRSTGRRPNESETFEIRGLRIRSMTLQVSPLIVMLRIVSWRGVGVMRMTPARDRRYGRQW